jgi:hypothetical protein
VLVLVAFAVLLPGAAIARQDPNADKTSQPRRGPSETLKEEIAENEARLDRGEKKSKGSGFRIVEDPEGNPYVTGELIVSYKKGPTGPASCRGPSPHRATRYSPPTPPTSTTRDTSP